ncbi:MAG: hypothetical protein Q9228_006145 [Teloschistes exilis]
MCGNDDRDILEGTPWLVANSMYGASAMVGSHCTSFDRVENPPGENPRVVFTSDSAIEYVANTLTLSTGNICFDFILSPAKGDFTSPSAQELMLWLQWEGGQLPIGWDRGPVATIPSLFGTSWKLYEDINTGNGMTVHSLLPDTQFSGSFERDLKEWFEALIGLGRFEEGTFVNVGNAG